MWSSATLITSAQSGSNTLTASRRPPRPTSRIATSTFASTKSAIAASNNAMESVQKVVKQASEAAEANLQAVTSTAVNAAKTASKKR